MGEAKGRTASWRQTQRWEASVRLEGNGVGDRTCRARWATWEHLAGGRARGGTRGHPRETRPQATGQQGPSHSVTCARDCQIQACGCKQPSKTRAFSLSLKASRRGETEADVIKHRMKEKRRNLTHQRQSAQAIVTDDMQEHKEGARVIR